MIRRVIATTTAFLALASSRAPAEVKPHALFSENAVLQQKIRVPVWGAAGDGEQVTVEFQGQTVSTVATNGRWKTVLAPLSPGGPFPMKIAGENVITLTNILVGEVWVASGQSNMGMGLGGCQDGKAESEKALDPLFRLLMVPIARSEEPLRVVEVKWNECTPYHAYSFSAVAYFFGRDLRRALKVPVGLIQSAWGGSIAEAWTPRSYLEADPFFQVILDRYPAMLQRYEQELARYQKEEPELKKKYEEAAAKARADGAKEPPPPAPPKNPAENTKVQRDRPYGIYNAMIHPIQPFAIRGAIWYQGESSAGRAYEYYRLFPTMIRSWRETWGQDDPSTGPSATSSGPSGSGQAFPFLFVQLPPYYKIVTEPTESAWAELRDAQLAASKTVPNTAMAVITDCGSEDLHPAIKEPIGARLALAARKLAYGENVESSGPLYDSMKMERDRIAISFTHADGGLEAKDGPLKSFTIAGEDKKFVNAQAEIHNDKVVVWNPEVSRPVAVRYGWANFPVINLYNKQGLPASPFRTDAFPLTTQPR